MSNEKSSSTPEMAQKPSYEVHIGFAEWHIMLAQLENLPVRTVRELVSRQLVNRPGNEQAELAEPVGHLQKAANHFKEAAIACAEKERVAPPVDILQRAEIGENCRLYRQISDSMEQIVKMVQRGEMPTIDDIHFVESLLHRVDMAMEQNARIRAAVEALQDSSTT